MKGRSFLAIVGVIAGGALTAHPAWGQTIVSRGVGLAHDCFIYAKAGNQPRDGITVCNEALKREMLSVKDRAATHDNRGVMLNALGQMDNASWDFNESIRLDPSLGDPHVNLGVVLIRKGRHQEALDSINRGLALGMSFPHIGYFDRGVAYEMMGQFREAYYDYKKVLELDPNYAPAIERLKYFTVTRAPAKS
ncbi:MAG: hypothetical protein BGN82_05495 [Alphaproteobacteria bacterium 65-7]|nr:MAG: hypothetical protein BGN82_05495 [Alphaproteobacteria bacterium 65-7]